MQFSLNSTGLEDTCTGMVLRYQLCMVLPVLTEAAATICYPTSLLNVTRLWRIPSPIFPTGFEEFNGATTRVAVDQHVKLIKRKYFSYILLMLLPIFLYFCLASGIALDITH